MTAAIRIEHDSFGDVEVSAEALWGAQTQRSLVQFRISTERMPVALLMALARIKRICSLVNGELGQLDEKVAAAIAQAADEVLVGAHSDAFPLVVWQTGSGTQTNMNMNEVLANRASELLGSGRGVARCVHPNDHVNLGQSSNDIFPTAMHVAAVYSLTQNLRPALRTLQTTLAGKSTAFADIVKIGRTHLQDATPLTLGQEISGWVAQLEHADQAIVASLSALYELAVGGTAVGTGLNTHPQFGERVADRLGQETGFPFRCAANRFAAQAAHDPLVNAHGTLKTLAVALMKIANDIRWLASGPRCGFGELRLPENEPGSSIMPGKVNPTQCEALTMVCCQVLGNDVALSVGGASGNFELNVFKPLIAYNFLQSVRLLADAMTSFETYCGRGIEPNHTRIAQLLAHSLMLVTALSPHIGYEHAAAIANHAYANDISLREAALALGYVTEAQFDEWVQPERMV
ncbi:MAG: fumarate hydratase [Gammaproteobacteria bacterium (ex Lamellibrachia satsuma)]|nr:MAG: class II fumarate hydratase [Gammaproteobacteria bacterium (ex Lamellibrachia satsuma)]RRS35995.1 MAG: fumarate hydratase [Gammaproteobacteria bacterium (ex Lamellibrachia satsuma)]RRS36587.1 MAG: fumarate hydratase [Gammaproteobacteria bacterium (ex Lamellibrachia satsuma)]